MVIKKNEELTKEISELHEKNEALTKETRELHEKNDVKDQQIGILKNNCDDLKRNFDELNLKFDDLKKLSIQFIQNNSDTIRILSERELLMERITNLINN